MAKLLVLNSLPVKTNSLIFRLTPLQGLTSYWEFAMIKSVMKKIGALIASTFGFLATAIPVFAVPTPTASPVPSGVTINIIPPDGFIKAPIETVVQNALIIIFSAATFLVLVFLIIGAFKWITSGGDKDAVGNARKMITNALIGLVILALAFVIVQVIGRILGTNLLQFQFPYLGQTR